MRSTKLTSLVAAVVFAAIAITPAAVSFGQAKQANTPAQPQPALYSAAESAYGGFIYDLGPDSLRKRGPYKLLWIQWIGLPIVVLAAWIVGYALMRGSRAAFRPLVHRTAARWDDALIQNLSAPVTFGWMLIATFFLLPMLDLKPAPLAAIHKGMRILWTGCIFWVLARAVDVASQVLAANALGPSASTRRALLPLLVRAGKIIVFALAVVALLSEAGYSVGSLLAGLGIGGLAVALAAQKTFEHWLGAFAIAVDQPFREGDWVRVNGLQGTVEQIGMRSTRLRTLERTIVSIPNGKLAEMQPETFSPRDRTRLNFELRLVYGTSSDQIREVLAGVERVLRELPKMREDTLSVVLKELGVAAIVLEVAAFFETLDPTEFARIKQDALLAIMGVVERAGTKLAVPAQRVELVGGDLQLAAAEATTGVTSRDSLRRG